MTMQSVDVEWKGSHRGDSQKTSYWVNLTIITRLTPRLPDEVQNFLLHPVHVLSQSDLDRCLYTDRFDYLSCYVTTNYTLPSVSFL